MIKRALPLLLLAAGLFSCGPKAEQGNGQQVGKDTVVIAPTLNRYYADTLPCADCPGIYTQLELLTDSTYAMLHTYLERSKQPEATFGSYVLQDGKLTLEASPRPMYYQVVGDSLRALDINGKPIDSPLSYNLAAQKGQIDLTQPFSARGSYFYMADAASFTFCNTRKALPVHMDKANLEAERRFMKSNPGSEKRPITLRVIATVKEMPNMEGTPMPHVTIEKIESNLKGCQ